MTLSDGVRLMGCRYPFKQRPRRRKTAPTNGLEGCEYIE